MALNLIEFETREAASQAAAALAAVALESDIGAHGQASLMVSGGSTPVRMFERLMRQRIEWARVTVGLVDERWVAPDHPDSNERLVRTHLLNGDAAEAPFLPMKTGHAVPEQAVAERSAVYAPHCRASSLVVLGMGEDGHTASWFPGAANLRQIVARDQPLVVAAVHAPDAIVPQRMTLTGAGILTARRALLLVFGDEKRSMLLRSGDADPMDFPVRFALDGLGDRLSIFWAP